jgi:hypothetical protein
MLLLKPLPQADQVEVWVKPQPLFCWMPDPQKFPETVMVSIN